jgi:hypothetical protein
MSNTEEATKSAQDAGSHIVIALAGLTTSAAGLAESQLNVLSASLSKLAQSITSLQSLAESAIDKTLSTL